MEKKLMNRSLFFAVLALIAGVFYREFTKFNGFTGRTALAFMHPHLIVLGAFFFILILLFYKNFDKLNALKVEKYTNIYIVGLLLTVIMMLVRGITQVLNTALSMGQDKAISGIAGLGHIILGITLLLIINEMRKAVK